MPATTPLPLTRTTRIGILLLAMGALYVGGGVAFDDSIAEWLRHGAVLVVVAGAVVVGARRQQQQVGGAVQMRLLELALREGVVPPQADRASWRPVLERLAGAGRPRRRAPLVVAGVPALLALLVACLVAVDDGSSGLTTALPLAGVALALFAVGLGAARVQRRGERRARGLLEQL